MEGEDWKGGGGRSKYAKIVAKTSGGGVLRRRGAQGKGNGESALAVFHGGKFGKIGVVLDR